MLCHSLVSNKSHVEVMQRNVLCLEMRKFQPGKVKLWGEKYCLPKLGFPELANENRGLLVLMGYTCSKKLFTVYRKFKF